MRVPQGSSKLTVLPSFRVSMSRRFRENSRAVSTSSIARCTWPTTTPRCRAALPPRGRGAPVGTRSSRGRWFPSRSGREPSIRCFGHGASRARHRTLGIGEVEGLADEVIGAAGERVRMLRRDRVDGRGQGFLALEQDGGVKESGVARARVDELQGMLQDDDRGRATPERRRVFRLAEHGERDRVAVVGGHRVEVGDSSVTAPIEVSSARRS